MSQQVVVAAIVVSAIFALTACVPATTSLQESTPLTTTPQTTAVESEQSKDNHEKLKPPPIPEWQVGDRWDYSDGYSVEVSEVSTDGSTIFHLTDGREQWLRRRAFFVEASFINGVTRTVVFRTSPPMRLFEVPPGTPVSFMKETMRGGELLRHNVSWIVEGRETITVPAGTFDCWLLTQRISSVDNHYQAYERWWYSDVTKNYVRLEYKSGENPEMSRVLMTYKLKKLVGGKI